MDDWRLTVIILFVCIILNGSAISNLIKKGNKLAERMNDLEDRIIKLTNISSQKWRL